MLELGHGRGVRRGLGQHGVGSQGEGDRLVDPRRRRTRLGEGQLGRMGGVPGGQVGGAGLLGGGSGGTHLGAQRLGRDRQSLGLALGRGAPGQQLRQVGLGAHGLAGRACRQLGLGCGLVLGVPQPCPQLVQLLAVAVHLAGGATGALAGQGGGAACPLRLGARQAGGLPRPLGLAGQGVHLGLQVAGPRATAARPPRT